MTSTTESRRGRRRLALLALAPTIVLTLGGPFLAACTSPPTVRPSAAVNPAGQPSTLAQAPPTPAPGVGGDPAAGARLFRSAGCAGCHTLAGAADATGVAGPNLSHVVLRPTLAGDTIAMTPETLAAFLHRPSGVKPATTMPDVGLTTDQARDVAAFLYSLAHMTPR